MSVTSHRCAVCNQLLDYVPKDNNAIQFCDHNCKEEYDEVSERLWELNQDEEPVYNLDPYYDPYGPLACEYDDDLD